MSHPEPYKLPPMVVTREVLEGSEPALRDVIRDHLEQHMSGRLVYRRPGRHRAPGPAHEQVTFRNFTYRPRHRKDTRAHFPGEPTP